MAKEFWINLPVKDLKASQTFFKAIGFTSNPMHEQAAHCASFFIGDKKVVMMLFPEETFSRFTNHPVGKTTQGTEVLFNIDAANREEVDAMAKTVKAAGGTLYSEPAEAEGWMYAFGFIDLDGHRWSMLHMDFNELNKPT